MTDIVERLRQYDGRNFEVTACYNGLRDEAAEEIERLRAEKARLLKAARLARHALDNLMGDTDLDGDDSDEMLAMQALSTAIAETEGGEK